MQLFTDKDIETVWNRANYNSGCDVDECYDKYEVREVMNLYLLLLRDGKIQPYNPYTNSAQISEVIEANSDWKLNKIKKILWEMYYAIADKKINIFDKITKDDPDGFDPSKVIVSKLNTTNEEGLPWTTIAFFAGLGVVGWYYFSKTKKIFT